MNILFRVDASAVLGTGHLSRCVTLASALVARGANVRFVCRRLPGVPFQVLKQRGYRYEELPSFQHQAPSQIMDAEQTIETAKVEGSHRLDWLVVDHYGLDARWEKAVRPVATRIMVIDDLADRLHDCDLLLDQTDPNPDRYSGLVNPHCSLLLGPKYVPLAPEYAQHRNALKFRHGPVRRIFVYFGGTDEHNLTGTALEALSLPEFRHIDVDLVIGVNYRFSKKLSAQAALREKTRLHGPLAHLADLMAQADFAIGAGGLSCWERLCLSLPSLVISLAENQVRVSERLQNVGAVRWIGRHDEASVAGIARALLEEFSPNVYARRASRAALQCDGLGAQRVTDVMFEKFESDSLPL